ncbi:hypothetical protein [Thermodesulfovibrio sp. TK110]
MDFLNFTYPFGYVYFNEALVWQPVAFAYSFLISGADLLFLAAIAYFTKKMTEWIPVFLLLGLSFFSIILLGPLADLSLPYRAWRIMFHQHLFSSAQYPGMSVMALYGGVLWIITFLLGVAVTGLYMSNKSLKYSFLYADENRYKSFESKIKILFIVLVPFTLMWSIYPGILFISQTWLFGWRNWGMLPAMLFSETFVTATASAIIVGEIFKKKNKNLLLYIHSAAAIVLCALIFIQILTWTLTVRGTMYSGIYSIYPLLIIAFLIFASTATLSIIATKKENLVLWVGIVALIGVIINKWNMIINAQLISRTGMGTVKAGLHGWWFFETLSPIAIAIIVFLILSSIYPLRGESYETNK